MSIEIFETKHIDPSSHSQTIKQRCYFKTPFSIFTLSLIIYILSVAPVFSQETWCPSWWPTSGWGSYPFGSNMNTKREVILTSQYFSNRGFGVGKYSCTTARFIATRENCPSCGVYTYRGCPFSPKYKKTDEIYEVICINNYTGKENNLKYTKRGNNKSFPNTHPKNPAACPSVGNPVSISTGNKHQIETDYQPYNAGKLEFKRYYSSLPGYSDVSRIGNFWRHTYMRSIQVQLQSTRTAVVKRPDGQEFSFKSSESDWLADNDVSGRLTELTNSSDTRTGWQYKGPDETVEEYDAKGKLVSISGRNRLKQLLSYTHKKGTSFLNKVTDPFGRTLTFIYDSNARLKILTTPDSESYFYLYDEMGNLKSVTYPDGNTRSYLYNEPDNIIGPNLPYLLTGIIDENGHRFATWSYDKRGQAFVSEHAGGADRVELTFNSDNTTTVTDALGQIKTYHFDVIHGVSKVTHIDGGPCDNCAGLTQSSAYDANGNLSTITDYKGNLTEYTFETDRNLQISRTEAVDTSEQRTTKTHWHRHFRLPVQIEIFNHLNQPLKRTSFSYDATGKLLTLTETDVASNSSRSTTYSYNTFGLLASIDGPLVDTTDITKFDYDDQGNLVKITNALSHETTFSDYDSSGRVQTITDPDGLVTTLTYHPRGWIISSTVDGNTTTFDYDKVGQLIKLTRPDATFTRYTYDTAHRLTDITDNSGNSIHYTLDVMGNQLSKEIKDASGNITSLLEQEYDQLSRLLLTIGGENQTQQFQYDANGNQTTLTDARHTPINREAAKTLDPLNQHNTLSSTYDALNRLIESIHRQQSESDSDDISSTYKYNSLDQLIKVIDPNGLETHYRYNALGDLLERNSPDTGITTYRYDQAGNRISQTDARNITVNFSYDALNRLTDVRYPDSSLNISYSYDENDNGQNGINRITTMTDANGSTHYRYDKRGNLTSVATSQSLLAFNTRYLYNEVNQIIQITYPSGRLVDYAYDNTGRISEVSTTDANGNPKILLSDLEYLPFGPISHMLYGNGLTTQHSFDKDYRQTEINTPPILDQSYAFDEANNITEMTRWLDHDLDQIYGYDGLSRLIHAQNTTDQLSYQYDAAGNRIQAEVNSSLNDYSYFFDNHHLDHINGSKQYSYDANGNTTHLPNPAIFTDLSYGQHNRLTQVNGMSYTYNGNGERVKKVNALGLMTRYHYDQHGLLIAETDVSGHSIKDYIYLNDQLIALATNKTTTPLRSSTPVIQEINLKQHWKTINYDDTGHIPVFFAGVPSYHGKHPGVIRLKEVTTTKAKIAFKEWNYLDGKHVTEQVSLLKLKQGRHSMPDGSIWEIGTFSLNGTRKWRQHTFGQVFPEPPKVFLTAQTANNKDTVTVRAKAITPASFKAALFEQESKKYSGHPYETIAYLAIYSPTRKGTANLQDTELPYQLETTRVNHRFKAIVNHSIKLEEEQSKDRERYHLDESIAVLNLAGHLFAQNNSSNEMDTIAIRRNSSTSNQKLQLQQSHDSPQQQAVYFVHNDHLKTPQVITDDQQTIVWQADYDPFGKANVTTELIENNIRFPGQYYDSETDLHYNYFRYYDPSIGRYITSDPVGLAGGLNTYAYVGGNPLKYSDPKGLFFWDVLDLGFFAQSLYAYSQCSSSDNAINLGLDTVGLLPGIPALGTFRRINAVDAVKNGKKYIVLGEGMQDIKTVALQLQSHGVNAKWYQTWSKNFPNNRPMNPKELTNALNRNERWLKTKIKQGYQLYDIGINPTRSIRSPFYQLEQRIVKKTGAKTIKLNRPN